MTVSIPPLEGEIVRTADEWIVDLDGQASLPELAAYANQCHSQAEGHARNAVVSAWHAGQALIAAKALCEHGTWLPWLEANFHASRQTADNYISLAKNCQHVGNLDSSQSIRAALAAITAAKKPPKPEEDPAEDLPDSELSKHKEFTKRLTGVVDDAYKLLREYEDSHIIHAHLLEIKLAVKNLTTTLKEYQNGTEE